MCATKLALNPNNAYFYESSKNSLYFGESPPGVNSNAQCHFGIQNARIMRIQMVCLKVAFHDI